MALIVLSMENICRRIIFQEIRMFQEDFEEDAREKRDHSNKSKKKIKIRDRFGKSRKSRFEEEDSLMILKDFERGKEEI